MGVDDLCGDVLVKIVKSTLLCGGFGSSLSSEIWGRGFGVAHWIFLVIVLFIYSIFFEKYMNRRLR
jgi:hypothetical protein